MVVASTCGKAAPDSLRLPCTGIRRRDGSNQLSSAGRKACRSRKNLRSCESQRRKIRQTNDGLYTVINLCSLLSRSTEGALVAPIESNFGRSIGLRKGWKTLSVVWSPDRLSASCPAVIPVDIMWKCKTCSAEVESGFEICWKCGSLADGQPDPNFVHADGYRHSREDSPINMANFRTVPNFVRPKVSSVVELYRQVTPLRRQDVCSKLIVAHLVAIFAIGYVPLLFPIGILTTIGVVIVCIMAVTGPIYLPKLDHKRGVLKQWGIANKIAAIVILVLFVAGYGSLIYWLFFRT